MQKTQEYFSLVDGKEKIGWNPAYRVEILDDSTVIFWSELDKIVLKGKVISSLARFISTGNFCADEIVQKMDASGDMVYFALLRLERKKLIYEKTSSLSKEVAAFCGMLNTSEKLAAERLQSTKVYVEAAPFLKPHLTSIDIQVTDKKEQANFLITCVHDYLEIEEHFPKNVSWLLCKPYGSEIWVGPYFEPGKTGCYQCLASRLKINRLEESYIQHTQNLKSFTPPSNAMLETTWQFALNWIATEVFKLIVMGGNESLEGKIQTFNTINLKKKEHILVKKPTCKICGNSFERKEEIVLQKRKKIEKAGGYRTLCQEQTLKKFEHLVSPITGVVRSLVSITSKPPLYAYASDGNWALPNFQEGKSINTFRNTSGGKGTSEVAAKASCLCEALERMSGVYCGDETVIMSSYEDLYEKAIHPNDVMLFSHNQFDNREKLNKQGVSFWRIPHPFSEKKVIPWTPLYSLTQQKVKYFPTGCCYYRVPLEWYIHSDSNGCAAGNNLEEAILQGFLELVERDSIALWWYNQLKYPSVDLHSFQLNFIEALLEQYASLNRKVWVLDITSDLNIPTFAAFSALKDSEEDNIFMGFGAHMDVEVALIRALTELNQLSSCEKFWEKSFFGKGEQEKSESKVVADWMTQVKVKDYPYLKNDLPEKKASDYEKWESEDLLQDIDYCRKVVEERSMEFLVLDQTRPEIGLNVARVIVPGLRHFWPRFASGRLYDIPVQMGKLTAPLKESELNPKWMFL